MATVEHDAPAGGRRYADAPPLELLWSRFLHRVVGAPLGMSATPRDPIFRIDRGEGLWTVTRPGAEMEHGFGELGAAVAFIRRESGELPATVELRVSGVYAVAYLRPGEPRSLFGEAA